MVGSFDPFQHSNVLTVKVNEKVTCYGVTSYIWYFTPRDYRGDILCYTNIFSCTQKFYTQVVYTYVMYPTFQDTAG